MLFEFASIDETIDLGGVSVFEGFEDGFGDFGARHARRQGAVRRQIVDRDSDLLGETGRGEDQHTEASEAKETG